ILGIEDKPVDDDVLKTRAAGDGGAKKPNDEGELERGDASDESIDCLGAKRKALFCDGFEGASLDPAWERSASSNPPAFVNQAADTKVAGEQSLWAELTPAATGGFAVVRWARPGGSGPLSLQISIMVPSQSWDKAGQAMPLARLRSGSSSAVTLNFV